MRHVLAATVFVCAISTVSATPYFSEVLPNTDDDAVLEYFALRNPSCSALSLSGFSVADASWKTFAFAPGTSLGAMSSASFYRPQTKIALNNENETLSLFDPFGVRLDFYAYATSAKGVALARTGFSDDVCRVEPVPVSEPLPQGADQSPEPPEETHSAPDGATDVETLSSTDSEIPQDIGSEVPSASDSPSEEGLIPSESESSGESDSGALGANGSESVAETPSSSDQVAVADVPISQTPSSFGLSSSAAVPVPVSVPAQPSVSRAVAESLRLVDENSDGRFDFADVRYSENLAGTADPSEYFLYSNTGGLYAEKVATATGFFKSASISWSVLRLWFSGTTLLKTTFRTDASTASEFRIKSLSTASLRTASSWLPVVPLTLTTSFSGYSADRVSYYPGFPEAEPDEYQQASPAPSQLSVPATASATSAGSSGTKTGAVPAASVLKSAKDSKAAASKSAKNVSSNGASGFSKEPVLPPEGLAILPSSGVDLLPSGKYRYVCFSTSCPVSFKAEGIPAKSRSYWLFSDGRKRFWTSTSVIGKTVPATYRLAFVVESAEWTSKTPVDVSVVADSALKNGGSSQKSASGSKTSASAKKTTRSLAASTSSPSSKKASEKSVPKTSAPKSGTWKTSSAETGDASGKTASTPIRAVSAALASVFVGLSAGAGWFAYRRRSWLPEETP